MTLALTWTASLFCALGFILLARESRNYPKSHFMIVSPLFLPLYFAGIVQWFLWGVRSEDSALIFPTLVQILFLLPVLKNWYIFRVSN